MNSTRHRLDQIDPILYLLNDDGQAGVTVVVHGAGPGCGLFERPDSKVLSRQISEAQLKGRVYLLSWRSGFNRIDYCAVEDNAHRLGNNLRSILAKIPGASRERIRLIGYSLGAHVLISGLFANDWKDWRLQDLILLGTALCEDDFEEHTPRQFWRRILGQVRGTVFNCYNRYDYSLYLRKVIQWSASESIGRASASHVARRIKNIPFTGQLLDDDQHGYLDCLDWVLGKVYPSRHRSSHYAIKALCGCPYCGEEIEVTSDIDSYCPYCLVEFEYRSADRRFHWVATPQLMECPLCDGTTGILIQESAAYPCPDCRRRVTFERSGRSIWWSS